jgi:ABC transport system ATP-binding/permease protein
MIILEIEDPSGSRSIVHISAETVSLGRGKDNLVLLDHETVSKRHAEIARKGVDFVLRDLESYNGTYLNGRWITETQLRFKDRIGVGRFTLTFLTKVMKAPRRRKA